MVAFWLLVSRRLGQCRIDFYRYNMNRFARVLARNVAPVFRRGSVHAVQQVSRRSLHSSLLGIVRTRFPAPVFSQQPQFVRFFSDEDEVINVMVPGMGDSIEEGTIVEWVKGPGDWVRVDDIIVLVETDKVVVEIRAEHEGQILNVHAEVDDSVDVGAPLLDLAPGDVPEGEGGADAGNTTPDDNNAPAPAANDQSAKTEEKPPAEKPAPPAPAAAPAAPDAAAEEPAGDRIEERVKMSRMRKTIAKNLKHAQNTAALLTSFQEVDMSALIEMRKKHKDAFEAKFGTKLGFMSPFMKACGLALQEVPAVNSQLDEDENIVYRNYSDISVAVATPTGLVMPVVRNCHSQSLAGMESDLNDLAARARTREISMEEMQVCVGTLESLCVQLWRLLNCIHFV